MPPRRGGGGARQPGSAAQRGQDGRVQRPAQVSEVFPIQHLGRTGGGVHDRAIAPEGAPVAADGDDVGGKLVRLDGDEARHRRRLGLPDRRGDPGDGAQVGAGGVAIVDHRANVGLLQAGQAQQHRRLGGVHIDQASATLAAAVPVPVPGAVPVPVPVPPLVPVRRLPARAGSAPRAGSAAASAGSRAASGRRWRSWWPAGNCRRSRRSSSRHPPRSP